MTDKTLTLMSKEDQEILGELNKENITPQIWQHAEQPRNKRTINQPDGQAALTGICEDTIGFQLRLKENKIVDIAFQADGCGFTFACGSVTTELVQGKSIKEALGITGEKIQSALGGLPRSHSHCADLAANALGATLRNALESKRSPWKQLYSKK